MFFFWEFFDNRVNVKIYFQLFILKKSRQMYGEICLKRGLSSVKLIISMKNVEKE
jgi:hypothetical protein